MSNEDNKKLISIVKLGLWLIFIVVIIIIASFGGKQEDNDVNNNDLNNQQAEVKILTYEEKLTKLGYNFNYEYEIKVDGIIYKFVGSKLQNKETGYRLNDNEYLYYYIENDSIYEIRDDLLFLTDNLYENIDLNNLDVLKIKENIVNKEYIQEDNKYSYILDNNKILSIYTDTENITKMEIYVGENYYKLAFSDIGLVDEIKY